MIAMLSSPKRFFFFILGAIAIVVFSAFVIPFVTHAPDIESDAAKVVPKKAQIVLGSLSIDAEVADDDASRALGLSGRESLGENKGLFFIFDASDLWGIWMKDMKFAIDVVWLSESLRITHIEEGMAPETYPKIFFPSARSLYVLELPAGTVERSGATVGQTVSMTKNF